MRQVREGVCARSEVMNTATDRSNVVNNNLPRGSLRSSQMEIDNAIKVEQAKTRAEEIHKAKLEEALEDYEMKMKAAAKLSVEEERKERELEEEQREIERAQVEAEAGKKIVAQARKNIGRLIRRAAREEEGVEEVKRLKAELARLESEAEGSARRLEMEESRMHDKERGESRAR